MAATAGRKCNGMEGLCPLRYDQVTYPATHNSGSHDLKYDCKNLARGCKSGPILCGGFEALCDALVPEEIEDCLWQNHDKTIKEQLQDGIRSFDVDTCLSEDKIVNCHGTKNARALGKPLQDTLNDVKDWVKGNPDDVISFTFSNTDGDLKIMAEKISKMWTDTLGSSLFAKSGNDWPTLNAMIDAKTTVVVMFGQEMLKELKDKPKFLFNIDELIDDPYQKVLKDDDRAQALIDSYEKEWCVRKKEDMKKFQVIDGTIGLVLPQIAADLRKLKFPPKGICLRDMAKSVNYDVLTRIANFCSDKMDHIYRVRLDYYNFSSLFEVVKRLNELNIKKFGPGAAPKQLQSMRSRAMNLARWFKW
ncbi:PLC-like phosphodiesterase [Phlyctochytrium arcticum]|nr:PLC-like phosphodiesterase [Phlyctochytrium arcticum]